MTESVSTIEARADALVDSHQKLMRDLIALREKHSLSQEVVADRMGVSQPTVSSFERYDSNPTLSTLRRYALAVGARIENRVVDDCNTGMGEFTSKNRSIATWAPSVTQLGTSNAGTLVVHVAESAASYA